MIETYLKRLMDIFSKSFINRNNELILVPATNLYICLDNVQNEFDLKCRLLEWCSRDASKAQPYKSHRGNVKYQTMVREKINEYLGTDFSRKDMEIIYQDLGNAVNPWLTKKFISSDYDIGLLGYEELPIQ